MAIVEVKVPQLSESVAEATMLQWKKKVGESVAADEILIDIETDKVVLEVPAPAAGVLCEIVVADGGTVAAEQLIAKIDTEAEQAVARTFAIQSIPTLMVFKNGQLAATKVGAAPKSQLNGRSRATVRIR